MQFVVLVPFWCPGCGRLCDRPAMIVTNSMPGFPKAYPLCERCAEEATRATPEERAEFGLRAELRLMAPGGRA
jgi:predicted amidophosphoribosyltransferase